jgi:hypothetical protein
MKQLFAFTLIALLGSTSLFAQHNKMPMANDKRASPHDTVMSGNVSVTYGRPYKKGREIFGSLVPYDQVWRTGADEATQITFKKDGNFGGKPVKAGTYALFTIPGKTEWTIILNGKLGQWGAFSYDKVKDQDVLKVTVPVNKTLAPAEQFTIVLPPGKLMMMWDQTSVSVPVK